MENLFLIDIGPKIPSTAPKASGSKGAGEFEIQGL